MSPKLLRFSVPAFLSLLTLLVSGCDRSAASASTAGAMSSSETQDKKPESETRPTSRPAVPADALMKPDLMKEKPPAKFKVEFKTTAGSFTAEFVTEWAPLGVQRMWHLLRVGYFKDLGVFRMAPNFVCQFGLHGDPKVNAVWADRSFSDDPRQPAVSNTKGTITFATRGKNTRSNQFFINYGNNSGLDAQGFTPIGKVISGMDVVQKFNAEYGERPNQMIIGQKGNAYLKESFPKLTYFLSATILD